MTKVVTDGNAFQNTFYIYQWKHVEPGEIAQVYIVYILPQNALRRDCYGKCIA